MQCPCVAAQLKSAPPPPNTLMQPAQEAAGAAAVQGLRHPPLPRALRTWIRARRMPAQASEL